MIGACLTAVFFAGNAVCARRAALHYGATLANFLRLMLAAALLALWAHGLGQGADGGAFGWFFLSGAVGFGLGGLAMFHALPRLGSNLSMLIVQCGSALAAALAEWAWLGTRLTPAQAAFAALTLAGVVLGLTAQPSDGTPAEPGRFALGVVLAALSAVAQGAGAVISRKAFLILRHQGFAMDAATSAYQRTLGGLAIGLLSVAVLFPLARAGRTGAASARGSGKVASAAPAAWVPGWAWVLFNTLLGPVLGVACYQWALRTTPSGIVLPIVATAPLLTIPLARTLEPGRITRHYAIGAFLAVIGAAGLVIVR